MSQTTPCCLLKVSILTFVFLSNEDEMFSPCHEWNSKGLFVKSLSDSVAVIDKRSPVNHELTLVQVQARATLQSTFTLFPVATITPTDRLPTVSPLLHFMGHFLSTFLYVWVISRKANKDLFNCNCKDQCRYCIRYLYACCRLPTY